MTWKSDKQIMAEQEEQMKAQAKEIKTKTEALERICKTYDNVEDFAGVVSREVLDKYK